MLNRDGNLLWEYISRRSIDGVSILGNQVVSGERYPIFLEDGNKVGTYTNNACDITGIEATEDEGSVLVGCGDGYVYLLDSSKKRHWSYNVGKTSLDSSISPKGDYIAISGDKTVYILKSPDITPPIIIIKTPESGSTVSGTVIIDASVVEDSSYVTRVLIDGDFACSKLPCSFNTGASSEGSHEITIEVNDSGGNIVSETIPVTIKHSLLDDIASEISETQESIEEKQETIKAKEEALKEKISETLPSNLPPIREHRDYGTTIMGVLLILSVFLTFKILRPKIPKKGKVRRGKYKFKQ